MQNPLSTTTAQTMSSIEIAQLTGKEHKHVLRDIREQLYTGLYGHNFDSPDLGYPLIQGLTAIIDSHTKRTKEILLDREHSLTLMTGYDVKARHTINKRWIELENQQQAFKIPTTLSEALLLAGQLAAEKETLQLKIETDKPKVEFAMAIRNTDGKVSIGDFAKAIGTGQNRLFERLRNDGFLMASNKPYQHSIDRGLMSAIEQKPHVDSKGVSHPSFKTLITGKGQVYFEKRYRSNVASQPRLQLVQS